MKINSEIIVCMCSSMDHCFRLMWVEDSLYLTVHLTRKAWWRRLWVALKYVAGKRSIYGDFDEVLIPVDAYPRLLAVINKAQVAADGTGHA